MSLKITFIINFLFLIFKEQQALFYVELSKWLPINADCSHFPLGLFYEIQQRKPWLVVSTFQSGSINSNFFSFSVEWKCVSNRVLYEQVKMDSHSSQSRLLLTLFSDICVSFVSRLKKLQNYNGFQMFEKVIPIFLNPYLQTRLWLKWINNPVSQHSHFLVCWKKQGRLENL